MGILRGRAARIVLVWLGVGVFFSAQNVLVRVSRRGTLEWQWDIYHEFIYALTWAACTFLVLAAARRWRLEPGVGGGVVWRHLGVMLALAPGQITTTYVLHYAFLAAVGAPPAPGLGPWLAGLGPGIVWGTFTGCLYYWLILGVHTAFVYPRMYHAERMAAAELATRAARLQGRLAHAQLDALRLQLQPHFLFNTLNGVAALAGADPARAQRMLARLGDLLRQTLEDDGAAEVPVERELALLAPYVEIQQMRFGDRLRYHAEVAPEARSALVPALMLQPLVENAVQHGVSRRPDGATIVLRIERRGDRLGVEVEDDGPGLATGAPATGIGLANTRARLAQLYPDAHGVELRAVPSGGALVRIDIPFRTTG
jgi:two-component system, LytTR family, sensor kinase